MIDLSGNGTSCFPADNNQAYNSFAVVQGTKSSPGTFSTYNFAQTTAKNANTVTLDLYSDDCCTSIETISIGNQSECKQPNGGSFVGLTMGVGANLLGQGIHIWVCSSAPQREVA